LRSSGGKALDFGAERESRLPRRRQAARARSRVPVPLRSRWDRHGMQRWLCRDQGVGADQEGLHRGPPRRNRARDGCTGL